MILCILKMDEKLSVDEIHEATPQPKLDEEQFAQMNYGDLQQRVSELDEEAREQHDAENWWWRLLTKRVPVNFKSTRQLVFVLGAFASFAGILSGVDQSIISGATAYYTGTNGNKSDALQQNINPDQESLVSSLMPLGAMGGSMLMMPLNHFFGRRNSLIISCLWYTLGAGLCAGARSINMLFAGRFILGVGVGIEGGCVGIYISECVPPNVRGNLVSMYQFNIAFGEVLGYSIGCIFFDVKGSWRFMLGSSVLFSTILLAGLIFLPESPRWLVSKGKAGLGWHVWKRLRDIKEPEALLEYLEMRETAHREVESSNQEKWYVRWFELVTIKRNRRALVYASIMECLGQMTGVNAILYNMSNLMSQMHFSAKDSNAMSLVGGGALWLGAIPAILYMDKFGRRVWAQNILVFFLGLMLVGIGYLKQTSIGDNWDSDAGGRRAAMGVYFTGMIIYEWFFGSYACLTWVVPAESFNLRTRAQGMAICSTSVFLWNWIVTYNYTKMSHAMKYTGLTWGFYGGLAILGFFYQLFFMPETKGKTLEEIDDIFEMRTMDLVAENMRDLRKRFAFMFRGGRSVSDKSTRTPTISPTADSSNLSHKFSNSTGNDQHGAQT